MVIGSNDETDPDTCHLTPRQRHVLLGLLWVRPKRWRVVIAFLSDEERTLTDTPSGSAAGSAGASGSEESSGSKRSSKLHGATVSTAPVYSTSYDEADSADSTPAP